MRKQLVFNRERYIGKFTTFDGKTYTLYVNKMPNTDSFNPVHKRMFFKKNGLLPFEEVVDITSIDFSKSNIEECIEFVKIFESDVYSIISNPTMREEMALELFDLNKDRFSPQKRCDYRDNYKISTIVQKDYLIDLVKTKEFHFNEYNPDTLDFQVHTLYNFGGGRRCLGHSNSLLDFYVIYNPYITEEQIKEFQVDFEKSIGQYLMQSNSLINYKDKTIYPLKNAKVSNESREYLIRTSKDETIFRISEMIKEYEFKIKDSEKKITFLNSEYEGLSEVSVEKREDILRKKRNEEYLKELQEKAIPEMKKEIEDINKRYELLIEQLSTL